MTDVQPQPPSPRRRRRPAELRTLVLEAAAEVFFRRGYKEATTLEIARTAGVSRSVLTRHFPIKQELFRAAMAEPLLRFVEDWVPTWRGQLDSPWPDARLMHEFVADLYRNARHHRGAVRLLMFHGDQLEPELRDQVWAAMNEAVAAIEDIGKRELSARGFPTTRLEMTVRAALSMILGYTALEPAFGTAEDATENEVIDHLASLLLHGFMLRPSTVLPSQPPDSGAPFAP